MPYHTVEATGDLVKNKLFNEVTKSTGKDQIKSNPPAQIEKTSASAADNTEDIAIFMSLKYLRSSGKTLIVRFSD